MPHIDDLTQGKEWKGNEGQRWLVTNILTEPKKIYVELDLIEPEPAAEPLVDEKGGE